MNGEKLTPSEVVSIIERKGCLERKLVEGENWEKVKVCETGYELNFSKFDYREGKDERGNE